MSAAQKLALATYKYSDLDDQFDAFAKRNTPKVLEKHGGSILVIVKLVAEKQITYRWTFP